MNEQNKLGFVADSMVLDNSGCGPFSCDTCGKLFQSRQKLDVHRLTHSQVKKHVCAKCGAGFNGLGRLNRHLKQHSDMKPHKCSHCDQRYTQKENLQRHENRYHSNPQTDVFLFCKFCPSKFRVPKYLVDHIKKDHPQNLQPSGRRKQGKVKNKKVVTRPTQDTTLINSAVVTNNSTGKLVADPCTTSSTNMSSEMNLSFSNNINTTSGLILNPGPGVSTVQYSSNNLLAGQNLSPTTMQQVYMLNRDQFSVGSASSLVTLDSSTPINGHTLSSPTEAGNQEVLTHNNYTILKYLTQSSPCKLVNESTPTPPGPPSSTSIARTTSTTTKTDLTGQLNVCVQKVQLQSSAPLLGSRITSSPLSEPDRLLSDRLNNSDEGTITGSLCSSGLNATPYRVHRSANTHMLPAETGFNLSSGNSKKYSLNFALFPDPQLPENFMEDSMDNSNDCSSNSQANNSGVSLSCDKSCDKSPFSEKVDKVNEEYEKSVADNGQCHQHTIEDCEVITIDSDSNISAAVVADCDSDVEIVEEIDIATDNRSMEQSSNTGNVVEKENKITASNSQKSRSEDFEHKKKRRHFDSENSGLKANEISIVMYQAASPAKMPKLNSPNQQKLTNRPFNATKGETLPTSDFDNKKVNILAEKQDYCKNGIKLTVNSSGPTDMIESGDRIKPSVSKACDGQMPTVSRADTELVKDKDAVACLNEPPLITLFPHADSNPVTGTPNSISESNSNQILKSVEAASLITDETSSKEQLMTKVKDTCTEGIVQCTESERIRVQLIDSQLTSFSSSPMMEPNSNGLLGIPKLTPDVVISENTTNCGALTGTKCTLSETVVQNCTESEPLSFNSSSIISDGPAICLKQSGHVVTQKNVQIGKDSSTKIATAVLSKTNEHFAVINNTSLHSRCLENGINTKGHQPGTSNSNIVVQEVTLNKNGPSLFGRINQNRQEKADVNTTNKEEGNNKVLFIETGLDSSVPSTTVRGDCLNKDVTREESCQPQGVPKINQISEERGHNKLDDKSENGKSAEKTSKTDHMEDIRNQYKTKESRRKLWGLVQPPCANELLRAKRENLTLDDIYEQKISKLLEKIGLNTFQGIPFSQFFSNEDQAQKSSNGTLKNMVKKNESTTPNREELMAKMAQKARYREQVKVKVQALMEFLERRKNMKRNYPAMDNLSKTLEGTTENHTVNSGYSAIRSTPVTCALEPHLGSRIFQLNDSKQRQMAEVHKMEVSDGMTAISNTVVMSRYLPVVEGERFFSVPLPSKMTSEKMFPPPVGYSVKQIPGTPTALFDGVFKIPTKCAPSAYSSSRGVKLVLKDNKPAVIANRNINPQEVQIRQSIKLPVTVSNSMFHKPVLHTVTTKPNVNNVKVFQSVSHPVLMEPLSVVTSDTQQQHGSERPFSSYNQSSAKCTSPVKQFPWSTNSDTNPLLMSPRQNTSQKDHSVLTQIHHSPRSSVKVEASSKISTSSSGFDVDMQGYLSDLSVSRLPNQLHKNPAISPTGSSQNSLPDVDFMLMSNGTSPGKPQILSPLKLISGMTDSPQHSPLSPAKDTSPSKDGSLLTLHDIHPAELQALMSSPIKSLELENSNLSTASQTELLETFQNFLRDIPSNSVSPQPHGGSTSPQKLLNGGGKGGDSQSSFDQASSAFILSTLFDTSPNKDLLRAGGKSRFFKHAEPSVRISQPSQQTGESMYSALSPGESQKNVLNINTDPRCSSVSSDSQLSPTTSLDLSGLTADEEFAGKDGQKEDTDIPYVHKKLVLTAPELYDENTMDRIVS